MRSIFFIVTVVVFAAALPKHSNMHYPSLKIIGGQEATPHSIPYQVFFEVYNDNQLQRSCGGTLISENYILTLGNCLSDASEVLITLGAHNIQKFEETQVKYVSREFKIHEKRGSWCVNDIAVIKLPKPVKFTDAIKPVVLNRSNNTFEDSIGTISGWGSKISKNDINDTLSDVLNLINLEIISNEECGRYFSIDDTLMCTSSGNNGPHPNGDLGGPLTVKDVQIGIACFGVISLLPNYPSAYMRITSFLDWIQANSDVVIN